MSNLTHLQRRNKKVNIYVNNIRTNLCRIRNQLKSRIGIRIRKIIPDPQHWKYEDVAPFLPL